MLATLVIVRIIWSLLNLKRRPKQRKSLQGFAAELGHIALYGFMIFVPFTALIRAYGFGYRFHPFGIPVFSSTGVQNVDLISVGNQWHALLGWLFFVMIIGHISMVCVHRWVIKDGIDKRMSFSNKD